jgi:pilus biogenesis lipoprotein CpaD
MGLIFSGCSNTVSNGSKQARTYEQRHEIKLERTQNTLEIPVIDDGYISEAQEASIKSFLYQYENFGKSNLVITAPEVGIEPGIARTALEEIVKIAQKVGIQKDLIKIGTYSSLDGTSTIIRMNFETIVAKAPDCSGRWSKNLSDAYTNEISKGHGCSTRNNLAKMIVDPEDLVRMRNMGIGNSERSIDKLDQYIAGAVPQLSASSSQ